MKIYLDPGHGGSDPGAIGHGLNEKDFVLDLAKRIKKELRNYPEAAVKLSRTTDVTKSLSARTKEANQWGADIFLSIHCNAFNGRVRGYEDYTYHRLPTTAKARKYQAILHEIIATSIGIPNRGKKQANFHVLRESNMPAILTENGFIDHREDAQLMKQPAWREKVAALHVEGLVKIFNLKKATAPTKHDLYKVIAGSFQTRANAEARKLLLTSNNIPAMVKQVTVNGKTMYRVQAGAFSNRKNAESLLKQLASIAVDAFITK